MTNSLRLAASAIGTQPLIRVPSAVWQAMQAAACVVRHVSLGHTPVALVALDRTLTRRISAMLLQFAEKNRGMTRVMVGDALLGENERLQERINLFFDKIESTLRQSLKAVANAQGAAAPTVEAQARASVIIAFITGRLQRYARTGFKRLPTEHLEASLQQLM